MNICLNSTTNFNLKVNLIKLTIMIKPVFLISLVYLSLVSFVIMNTTSDSGFVEQFQVEHITKGDEKTFPRIGQFLFVHYTGSLPDGKVFDSSRTKGERYRTKIGRYELLKCWEEVLKRMTLGERIKVVCPSHLAFGKDVGEGFLVPANTDVTYDIELLEIQNDPEEEGYVPSQEEEPKAEL